MLEFQEGFFDQEVRDGFYLDTTMKTLWAAELEVLQKVAEVCDRHGLKWYAAYGTLLGAIRHEGFVPWDDDMDIWVKRPDYNILMQILPKELPEGYMVRGPLTDEGYDQFHTCLNSGNGISISKEWLDQYHGCPFTVGLDIFPLDYLPRNEKDRDLQVNLLTMTGRIAQLAKNINRGDYNPKDDDVEPKDNKTGKKNKTAKKKRAKTQKELVIEEINLGIDYLEKNCKLQIDHQLLEDEDWYKLSSELWKWANYLAMMYTEEESDYLVEFFDYIQCPRKAYPKEWFGDGYSASFENFMIPIPSGYDMLLRYIYGNYFYCIKKIGTHEYPYYARQLRQLREYVKDIQNRAQNVGLIKIDEIEVKEESTEIPTEWVPLTTKENGERKKIVLCANDPVLYAVNGNEALDKLEAILQCFERDKDSVLLWWRPQPVMKKILDQASTQLGERYQQILERYQNAGWGICDKTDNIDRAVEACDIYYGDMNAILQPFQNLGKPIVIARVDNDESQNTKILQNNEGRINECQAYLSMTDYVADEDKIYFANVNYNALVVVDKSSQMIVEHVPFEEEKADFRNMHLQCVRWNNQIYFLPAGVPYLHIYDPESKTQRCCHFLEEEKAPKESWGYFTCEDRLYLLPCCAGQKLWSIQDRDDVPAPEQWWDIPDKKAVLEHGRLNENCFYTLATDSDRLYVTDVVKREIKEYILPDTTVRHITYDGQNFWYVINDNLDIACWNEVNGVVDRYLIPRSSDCVYDRSYYLGIQFAERNLFLVSVDGRFLYVLDQDNRVLNTICHIEEYDKVERFVNDPFPYFKNVDHKLLCMHQKTGLLVSVDLCSLETIKAYSEFRIDPLIEEKVSGYIYQIMLDRNALLFEEKAGSMVKQLQKYCTEKGV